MSSDMWAVFCVIGFWGWVIATVGFIIKVFPAIGGFRSKMALLWGGCVLVFYSLWVVSMVHA